MPVSKRLVAVLVAVAGLIIAAIAFSSSAEAAPYGGGATISASSSTVAPGGTVTISGSGFAPGQTVTLTLHTLPYTFPESPTVQSDGTWSATVTIPSDTPTGTHTITATDPAGDSASFTITVTAAAPSGGGGISTTGVAVIGIASIGAVLLIGGMVMLLAGRRRNVVV
jgi:hypothetical protein